jgi:hypothetical protein
MKIDSIQAMRAEFVRAQQRIADLERELAEVKAECNRWWGECQKLKTDAAFYRQPAADRDYCPKCGKPRERECPDCGATFPE